MIGLAVFLIYGIMMWVPGTLVVFAVSLPAMVVMALSFRLFRSIDPSAVPGADAGGIGRKQVC